MATKKKVKAVEPEVVSSVEPEVAAVPMTMAAATPSSNGQSTNDFAKVEQGKSYVLSVNAPSGSGKVELLAADSNTQSEPDMFSLLYTKVENSMQIPFVAVSSWVYVQAGNSNINWLVTPANFSIAVPGVSSGGGESFDPEAPQEISGDWQFTGELTRTVKASPAANDVLNKEMGDNAYLQLATPNLQTVASDVNFQSPLGVGEPVDLNHAVSKGYSENNFVTTSTSQTITGGKTFADGGTLEVPIPTSQGMAANKQYVDTSVVTGITQLAIRFSSLTKAEYDALETKSNSTIYFLTDQNMWAIGDKEIVTSDNIMYTHFAYLTSAETKGIVAPVVALPAEAPEGFYRVKLWFGSETSSAAGSQPCDIWITTTSAAVSLPDISSNTSNLSISLNRASQLLVKGLDGNIYTCGFTSMGKRFTYPADSTLIGGELHVYHSASTPGSVKLSFKASSAEEEHDVVRVSFFQISGPVNQSE